MREWLFGNPHYKAAALLVAVLAWLYVQSDEVATGQVRAEIEWIVNDRLVPLKPFPTLVSLRVRGTRAAIRRAQSNTVSIPVDIRDIGEGDHDLEYASYDVNGLAGLEVLAHAPAGLRFTLDQEIRLPVSVVHRMVGTPAPGFRAEIGSIEPGQVELIGPAALVREVETLSSKPISVEGLMSDQIVMSDVLVPSGLVSDPPSVTATVQLLPVDETRAFQAPVRTWSGLGTMDVQSAVVELTGPASLVQGLDPEAIVVFVHEPEVGNGPYKAAWGSTAPGRVRVLHGGGPEVRTVSVTPPTYEVNR